MPVVDVYQLIDQMPKPVIAAVNGYAVGGGHVLQVMCDLTIAAQSAIFRQVGPMVGSFDARVPRDGKKDLVARFDGIPLLRNENGFIVDPVPVPVPTPRKELIHRLRASRCELCERHGTVAVHQVAKLARLGTPGPGQPAWAALMASKRRKTLVVCQPCHQAIHATPVTNAA